MVYMRSIIFEAPKDRMTVALLSHTLQSVGGLYIEIGYRFLINIVLCYIYRYNRKRLYLVLSSMANT